MGYTLKDLWKNNTNEVNFCYDFVKANRCFGTLGEANGKKRKCRQRYEKGTVDGEAYPFLPFWTSM